MILFVAIGGLLGIMGFIVLYASWDNPELEKVEIELANVEVIEVNTVENRAELEVTFLVTNPSEKTFTIPNISYELFANGNPIGSGQYSTEDIAMPGRAAFYPGAQIPLKNDFQLILSDFNAQEYQAITSGQSAKYSVEGMAVVETAWALIEKEFQSSM